MTPRALVNQAEAKAERDSFLADVADLGDPTGWITVNAQPMAYWLPPGDQHVDAEHDHGGLDPDAPVNAGEEVPF